jgi:hypothetical protein
MHFSYAFNKSWRSETLLVLQQPLSGLCQCFFVDMYRHFLQNTLVACLSCHFSLLLVHKVSSLSSVIHETWHMSVWTASTQQCTLHVQGDTKRERLKTPTKIEEIQEKKIIDRNWTITTFLLRDSNPHYQCLKLTSCRRRPPPRMHSFIATTHFKSSRSFVSHSAEHATHTEWHKRTGTFDMRSGSERMHTWRRTPSTGRNFQTLIIWITVS